jgi:hypothetical protein
MANVVKIKNSTTVNATPTGLVRGEIAINIKDKKLFFLNDADVLQSFNLFAPLVLTLASDFSSTSTIRADVTGMSFPVVAGKKYKISLIGDYQTGVTTTGGSIGFVLPSGTGTIKGFATMAVLTTTQTASDLTATIRAISNVNTIAGSFITSSAVSPINSPHYFRANLIFDCITTGVFQLQYASEFASSASKMNAGSCLIVETLN